MAKKKNTVVGEYRLKEGVEIRPFGAQCGVFTNENLTQEIAIYLIDTGKATLDQFESLGSDESAEQTDTTND